MASNETNWIDDILDSFIHSSIWSSPIQTFIDRIVLVSIMKLLQQSEVTDDRVLQLLLQVTSSSPTRKSSAEVQSDEQKNIDEWLTKKMNYTRPQSAAKVARKAMETSTDEISNDELKKRRAMATKLRREGVDKR